MEVIEHTSTIDWINDRTRFAFWLAWIAAGGDPECRFARLTFNGAA